MIAAADLGGHTLTAGVVKDGAVAARKTVPTPPERTPEAVCSLLKNLLQDLGAGDAPLAMAVPSAVLKDGQRLVNCPNLTGWNGLCAADLSRLLARPVFAANDCDCAAAGEMQYGAARGLTDFLYCTLGTGVGGAVVVGGKLLRGSRGLAGELGHFPLMDDSGCRCGGRGHLESFFSADVFEAAGESLGRGRDMKKLWQQRESARLAPVFTKGMKALAAVLAGMTHLLDPEAIVLGGGLSRLEGLCADLEDYMFPLLAPAYRPGPELRLASLGGDAPLIGAAALMKASSAM